MRRFIKIEIPEYQEVEQYTPLKHANLPLFINGLKDQFSFDLHCIAEVIKGRPDIGGKIFYKKTYYFNPRNLPSNYHAFMPAEKRLLV